MPENILMYRFSDCEKAENYSKPNADFARLCELE